MATLFLQSNIYFSARYWERFFKNTREWL